MATWSRGFSGLCTAAQASPDGQDGTSPVARIAMPDAAPTVPAGPMTTLPPPARYTPAASPDPPVTLPFTVTVCFRKPSVPNPAMRSAVPSVFRRPTCTPLAPAPDALTVDPAPTVTETAPLPEACPA